MLAVHSFLILLYKPLTSMFYSAQRNFAAETKVDCIHRKLVSDRQRGTARGGLAVMALALTLTPATASTCYGSVAKGSVSAPAKLPPDGVNFRAYSPVGVAAGRTYVHVRVRDVMLDTYKDLATAVPEKLFVYGETGLLNGGPMQPHRTHQNGLSVDFMVPVADKLGASVALPSSPANRFGYGWEFGTDGRAGDLAIDFDAMAEHLYRLSIVAKRRGVGIHKVIFDQALIPALLRTKHGPYLRRLPFMKTRPWIRYDEHYHVDFDLPCAPWPKK